MKKNKSSVSKATSYQEMGEFWDKHDLTDYWEQTKPLEFEVDIRLLERLNEKVDKAGKEY